MSFPIAHGDSSKGEWTFIEEEDGIKVFTKEIPGSSLGAFKGETVIDAPVSKLFNIISDHVHRKEWVDRLAQINLLQGSTVDRPTVVEYFLIDMPWPLTDRDFITESRAKYNAETGSIETFSKGVSHSKRPITDSVIRGETKSAHLTLNPLPNGKTHITMDVHADPGRTRI